MSAFRYEVGVTYCDAIDFATGDRPAESRLYRLDQAPCPGQCGNEKSVWTLVRHQVRVNGQWVAPSS